MRTIGLSPKLYPAVLAVLVGLVLTLVGNDIGVGILLTGISSLGLGVAAPPGDVVPKRSSPTD